MLRTSLNGPECPLSRRRTVLCGSSYADRMRQTPGTIASRGRGTQCGQEWSLDRSDQIIDNAIVVTASSGLQYGIQRSRDDEENPFNNREMQHGWLRLGRV